MKTINIKESLIRLDRQTGFKYTLTDLYEACMLNDDKKKELVQFIEDKDIPGMSAMLSNEAGVMTENVSDDIPDEEMPEDIGVEEDFRPGLTDCPACGDTSFDTKSGRCTKCSYRESLSGMDESWHDAYQIFSEIASDMYPQCSAEDVNNAVEDLYRQHQGEPDWDNAWLRWLEPSGEPEDEGFAEQQAKWEAECKRIKGHVGYSYNESLQEQWPFEDDDQSEYTFVKRKSVVDSDGFYTDYTWYKAPNGLNVFVFGDSEVYTPEEGYFDYETDSDEIAADWFDSYIGFADDDEYLVEGPLAVVGDAAGRAVGDAWKGLKNFAKGVAKTGKDVVHTANLVGKAAVRDVKASKVAAKARDAVRAVKDADNVDEFKADYRRRQDDRKLSDTKRETKYQGKRGATIGDVQDWKFVIGNRKMNYDQFMKLPSEQRANLIKTKKIKCFDLMGRETSFQDQAKRMNGLTEHLMRETYAHFDFKSGANPYIAFNDVEAARMLRKYKGKVTNTDGKFYTIDDTDDTPSDKFAVDRTLTERAGQSHPEEGQIYDALMKVHGTTKVEFDWCGSDGLYRVPENHLIMLVFTDNKFDDPYFTNRKNWKVGVLKALGGLGWSLEDPVEDCDTYLYLVMQKRQMNEATAVLDRPKVNNVHTHKGSFSGIIDAHMDEINDMINANVPASHIVHCLRDWVAVDELTKANARYAQSALVRMAKMRSAAEVGMYIYNIRLKAEDDSYASLDSQIRGNRYHESLNEAVLKEMDIDSQDLLVMANDAYKTGDIDFFTSRTDDELAQLWVSCSITDGNPYGAPYDDEVYDAIHDRPNGKEIMNRAFEMIIGKMPRHNLETVYFRYCGPDGCDLSDDDMRASIVKSYMNEAFESHVDLDRIAIDIANLLDDSALGDNWIEVFPRGSNNPYSLVLEITGADETPRKAMLRANGNQVSFMFKHGSEGIFNSAEEIARFIAGEYGLTLNEAYTENPRDFRYHSEDGYEFDEETGLMLKIVDYNEDGSPVYDIKGEDDRKKWLRWTNGMREAFEHPQNKGPHWYLCRHGIGPGALPKGVTVIETADDESNPSRVYVALDKVLTTDELKQFEMTEQRPPKTESVETSKELDHVGNEDIHSFEHLLYAARKNLPAPEYKEFVNIINDSNYQSFRDWKSNKKYGWDDISYFISYRPGYLNQIFESVETSKEWEHKGKDGKIGRIRQSDGKGDRKPLTRDQAKEIAKFRGHEDDELYPVNESKSMTADSDWNYTLNNDNYDSVKSFGGYYIAKRTGFDRYDIFEKSEDGAFVLKDGSGLPYSVCQTIIDDMNNDSIKKFVNAGKPEEERVALKEDQEGIEWSTWPSGNKTINRISPELTAKYFHTLSVDTPDEIVEYFIRQCKDGRSIDRIYSLLQMKTDNNWRGEKSEPYGGIDYSDATNSIKQEIIHIIKDDMSRWIARWKYTDRDMYNQWKDLEESSETLTEAMTYTDTNGFLGEPGETYTMSQFRRMWQDKDNDPVMSGYDSFEEWVGETISHMDSGHDSSSYDESLSFADMLKMNQSKNAEYEKRTAAKFESERTLAREARNWPDDKVLTYEEALALARAYYTQGGDGFYETTEKYQFDDEVRMFGPMTVGQMKRDFGVYDSVRRDRMTENKSELDKLNTSLSSLRDKLAKLRDERADQEEIDKVIKDIEDTNRKIATLVDDKILAEDYNVKFYQVFQNPEKPTDNGKMVAQAGTEEEAEEKGKKLCGDGNYFIKAVCDDGKTRYLR